VQANSQHLMTMFLDALLKFDPVWQVPEALLPKTQLEWYQEMTKWPA